MTVANFPVYKVSWLSKNGKGRQEYVQAMTALIAKRRVNHLYGIPMYKLKAVKHVKTGGRIPDWIVPIKTVPYVIDKVRTLI